MKTQPFTVYRLFNRLTGDTYIGASANFKSRISCHGSRARTTNGRADTTSKLYENIRTHGADNFTVMIVSTHSSRAAMLKQEASLIASQRPSLNTCGKR